MAEFTGTLRERVAIEQWVSTPGTVGAWTDGGAAWAALVPVDTSLVAVLGEREVGRPRFRLTVRTGTAAAATSRFRWRDRLLAVIRVEPDPRLPDRTTFLVEDRT